MINKHKGILQYGGDEGSNIALGQLGFKVLDSASESTGDGTFVAFKVTGGGSATTAVITATCHQGDGLTVTVLTGEIIWGAFKNITAGTLGTGVEVLCYYG
jgi:hypothetical protein|tara:strand:+ start:32 stop:334 length:303 start_codon:yes stop_codon:yes gene_type:complete